MAVSAPFGARVRFVKLLMFRFEPWGWQKTRTSSQLSIAISLPGTFIDTSTAGTVDPADRHCSDMMPGCDATPDQRRRTRPSACWGLIAMVL